MNGNGSFDSHTERRKTPAASAVAARAAVAGRESGSGPGETRDGPGGVGVREQRRPDRADEVDRDEERDAAADDECRGFPGSPRRGHFRKNRKRLTAEGPSEKKSPEASGRAQSSSETPPRSSG